MFGGSRPDRPLPGVRALQDEQLSPACRRGLGGLLLVRRQLRQHVNVLSCFEAGWRGGWGGRERKRQSRATAAFQQGISGADALGRGLDVSETSALAQAGRQAEPCFLRALREWSGFYRWLAPPQAGRARLPSLTLWCFCDVTSEQANSPRTKWCSNRLLAPAISVSVAIVLCFCRRPEAAASACNTGCVVGLHFVVHSVYICAPDVVVCIQRCMQTIEGMCEVQLLSYTYELLTAVALLPFPPPAALPPTGPSLGPHVIAVRLFPVARSCKTTAHERCVHKGSTRL
eukprot:jgi/Mesen1/7499/ME000039S06721